MSDDAEDPAPAMSAEVLDELRSGPSPPAALEERVVVALRREGVLAPARSSPARRWARYAAAAVLAGALFTAGLQIGRHAPPATAAGVGSDYLLLLYDAGAPAPGASAEAARAAEYGRWARQLRGRGQAVSGDRLANDRVVLLPGGGRRTGGPPAGTLGGFFRLRARDLEGAVRLAATCPHLRYGGTIELRRIAQ